MKSRLLASCGEAFQVYECKGSETDKISSFPNHGDLTTMNKMRIFYS